MYLRRTAVATITMYVYIYKVLYTCVYLLIINQILCFMLAHTYFTYIATYVRSYMCAHNWIVHECIYDIKYISLHYIANEFP